jgi:type I restriction enzyme R subunit
VQNLKDAIDKRLERMIRQNPTRTNFEEKYRELINEYNLEKDRVTIEQTFEALIRFVQDLEDEDSRSIREGLDDESLALFDLLKKDNLEAQEIKKIKKVAAELLELLKKEKLKANWKEKPPTRDDVKVTIKNYLWDETKGLPESYTEAEIEFKADLLFQHIFTFYPTSKHIYDEVA